MESIGEILDSEKFKEFLERQKYYNKVGIVCDSFGTPIPSHRIDMEECNYDDSQNNRYR